MSAKNMDKHNRFRSKAISVRMSPEEDAQVNMAVSLSGMTKQDYVISKLSDRSIVVKGNCKIHKAVYDRLLEVLTDLRRIRAGDKVDDELLDNINLIAKVIDGLYLKSDEQ